MKLSVHRALSELGVLEARINRAISEAAFVSIQVGSKPIGGHISPENFAKNAEASLASIRDLIARRAEIKSAIIASNAITQVTFPSGKVMSVAEVIERKNSIVHDRQALNMMRTQYTTTLQVLAREQEKAKQALEKRIENALGKETKGKEASVEEITKGFNLDNEVKFIDPIDLKKTIDKLTEQIEEFDKEADFLLSESNTRTDIEISG
jgi:hypothetical protein